MLLLHRVICSVSHMNLLYGRAKQDAGVAHVKPAQLLGPFEYSQTISSLRHTLLWGFWDVPGRLDLPPSLGFADLKPFWSSVFFLRFCRI